MKNIFQKYWLIILGIIVGIVGGYLYWHFIGCNGGTCPITSSPVNSSVAGGLIGGLLISSFDKGKKDNKDNKK
jgi:H+/Cl- antiporter ClcA